MFWNAVKLFLLFFPLSFFIVTVSYFQFPGIVFQEILLFKPCHVISFHFISQVLELFGFIEIVENCGDKMSWKWVSFESYFICHDRKEFNLNKFSFWKVLPFFHVTYNRAELYTYCRLKETKNERTFHTF